MRHYDNIILMLELTTESKFIVQHSSTYVFFFTISLIVSMYVNRLDQSVKKKHSLQ